MGRCPDFGGRTIDWTLSVLHLLDFYTYCLQKWESWIEIDVIYRNRSRFSESRV